jgi:DNA-binding NtrC family response regulator
MDLKPQIAMIDDEIDIIDSYKDLLGEKYTITAFCSAEDYLRYLENFKTNPFEVIITDYRLGTLTGLDMVEKAKAADKHTAFIVMSGFLNKENTLRAHNMGAHRILDKPTKVEMLDHEIKNLIYEFQIEKIRTETKEITLKMKELCGLFDVILHENYSEKQINEFFAKNLQTKDKKISNLNFKNYISDIEEKIYRNIKTEEILMRQVKRKTVID